ncbi:Trypanosomal VSG domain containing protein, putative [Trypanosoma equiperdum]|uniref:Trypanosomal VSG domain containing protein, putative n=1 Tax=Trypanosoma equiperdum TaxID=5694 RepID=A0A1G4IGZ4_TRYEQ|nr:Trypanosomal VSG domain containing protein, putative [Trypanosoma equiperdum]
MELPMRTVVLLIAVLQVRALERHVQGKAGDAKNGQQYRAMCTLVEKAKQTAKNLGKATLDGGDVDVIEGLNMSASSLAWQSKFPSKEPTEPAPAPKCSGSNQPIECHPDYNKWKSAKIRTAGKHEAGTTLKVFPGIQETALGKRTQTAIGDLATDAEAVYKKLPTNSKTDTRCGTGGGKLRPARFLLGKQTRPLSGEAQDKWTPTGTRKTDCEGTKAGISLRGDITCLCARDTTQDKHICGYNVEDDTTAWSNSAATADATRITATC